MVVAASGATSSNSEALRFLTYSAEQGDDFEPNMRDVILYVSGSRDLSLPRHRKICAG